MAERKTTTRRAPAKQEMLETYGEQLAQAEVKRENEATPELKLAQKAIKQAVAVADALTADGIIRDIGNLKGEIGKVLSGLAERLEQETVRYEAVKKAIAEKERELAEIYEIQKAASSLTALIDSQNLKKEQFEAEMAARKESLTREIEEVRDEWQRERALRNAEQKEQEALEAKKRARDKEEYDYTLQRERQAARDAFEKEKTGFVEEKARLEREIALRREQADREFVEREQALATREQELTELRTRVATFPGELEAAVTREGKAVAERVQSEAKFKLDLLQKQFEGERNVLQARIAALEAQAKDQSAQIVKLNEQVEKSYGQLQAIAVKAVEGSAVKVVSVPQGQKLGE